MLQALTFLSALNYKQKQLTVDGKSATVTTTPLLEIHKKVLSKLAGSLKAAAESLSNTKLSSRDRANNFITAMVTLEEARIEKLPTNSPLHSLGMQGHLEGYRKSTLSSRDSTIVNREDLVINQVVAEGEQQGLAAASMLVFAQMRALTCPSSKAPERRGPYDSDCRRTAAKSMLAGEKAIASDSASDTDSDNDQEGPTFFLRNLTQNPDRVVPLSSLFKLPGQPGQSEPGPGRSATITPPPKY